MRKYAHCGGVVSVGRKSEHHFSIIPEILQVQVFRLFSLERRKNWDDLAYGFCADFQRIHTGSGR